MISDLARPRAASIQRSGVDLDDVVIGIEHVDLREPGDAGWAQPHWPRIVGGRDRIPVGAAAKTLRLEMRDRTGVAGHSNGEVRIVRVDRLPLPEGRVLALVRDDQVKTAVAHLVPAAVEIERRTLRSLEAEHALVELGRALQIAGGQADMMNRL